jgi:hypothetical protein
MKTISLECAGKPVKSLSPDGFGAIEGHGPAAQIQAGFLVLGNPSNA